MSLKLLGNRKRGCTFIVSAPAGTGKTTLVSRLAQEFPCVVQSVSYTTRISRPGEVEGVHYNFISKAAFEKKIEEEEFLEFVCLYGCYYGTSRKWVERNLNAGKHVVLVIDTQGAIYLRERIDAIAIFILPPAIGELKRRLKIRGTETNEKIEERLSLAEEELKAVQLYDYAIINDDLEIAYQVLRSIFIAEEHRVLSIQTS
ncbi:MAG: guanylate kinase [Parachlamydiaceae bacterium]|nr:guanylate kinase [Parachlamydiaceae bacterium]